MPGYAATPPGYAPATAPTSSNAVIALILAVVSWAVCPLIAAVVALVFASTAAKEIAASGGRMQGEGLVTAARIVSWINIGVVVAGIIFFGFFALIVLIAGGTSSAAGY